MATYVLVHGAWHGGWCWHDVADLLRSAGHTVHTPTLTGLGERAHLRSPDTGLATHAEDVRSVLEGEDLRDVKLVGHSYAGFVVRQAADRVPDRVEELIMLDAWAGSHGESLLDRASERFRAWVASLADGDVLAVPPPESVGVTAPDQVARLKSLLTPHPRLTFTEAAQLTGRVDAVPCRAIVCTPSRMPFRDLAAEFGWEAAELESGHDAMVTAPDALTRLLLASA
ncbi:alpha/beta fold hydrolase [Streptomyces sp. Tue6028]|uniref:alpha/beta fold hydrolase n=1 Tax=Streptomyces sp. Tue6028 TaxID=2036037 RepID=UPI003EBF605A